MAKSQVSDAEILAQIPAAIARASRSRRTKPHAQSARYDRATRMLRVDLTNGATFLLPVSLIPALARASDVALAKVEVAPAGIGLHWEQLDVDLTVAGLARAAFGTRALRASWCAGRVAPRSTLAERARWPLRPVSNWG